MFDKWQILTHSMYKYVIVGIYIYIYIHIGKIPKVFGKFEET